MKHSVLYERILHVQDLQSARLLLLFCANTQAMYCLRSIPLSETSQFDVVADRNCSSRSGQHPMCFRRVGGNEVSPLASWADSKDDQSQASCSGRHHRPVFVRPLRFAAFQCRGHMRCRVPCRVMMFLSGGHSAQLWIVAERFQGVLVRRVGSMRQLRRFFWTLRSSQNWSQVSELYFVPKGRSLGRSPLHCRGPSSSLVFSHLPVWPSFRLP